MKALPDVTKFRSSDRRSSFEYKLVRGVKPTAKETAATLGGSYAGSPLLANHALEFKLQRTAAEKYLCRHCV